MNEERLLERIRESAEDLPVPESLQPGAIKKKLMEAQDEAAREQAEPPKEAVPSKHRRFCSRRLIPAAAAAAAVLLCTGILRMTGGNGAGLQTETAEESAVAEAGAPEEGAAGEGAAEATGGTEDAAKTGMDGYLAAAEDYDEIYEMLRAAQEETESSGYVTGGSGWASGAAAAAEEGESGTSSEAAEDAGSMPLMGEDVSGTNVQVEGVDEGDLVKTDGNYLYILRPDDGIEIIRAEDLDRTASISWEDAGTEGLEMYLDGDRLTVIQRTVETELLTPSAGVPWLEDMAVEGEMETRELLKILTYDIGDREHPELAGELEQEGVYLTSRRNGDELYIMSRFYPELSGGGEDPESYVPRVDGEVLQADTIYLPKAGEAAGSYSYFVATSVDLREPDQFADRCAVVTDASEFYVSTDNIYVTGQYYGEDQISTTILRFSYGDGQVEPEAGGSVPGQLNDSFSMDEYEGYLRVVTCDWSSGNSETGLYILDQSLQVAGRITDLARGESLKSSRFLGDTGYFVTFLETDPLFSVDLSDPENPEILGELKIPGFSSYLHFFGGDRLLGIGWEDNQETWMREVKLSMFDTSDPSDVRELHKKILEGAYECPGTEQHRSILVMEEKGLLGLASRHSDFGRTAGTVSKSTGYEDYYTLFRYVEGEGFQTVFRCLLNQEEGYGPENGYALLDRVRGVIAGDRLYIVMEHGLSAFLMEDGTVRKTGSVVWG